MKKINAELLIKKASEVPEDALKEFYSKMYPSRSVFLGRNWRWLYRAGRFDKIDGPWVAVLDGKVVGHAGQIPVYIKSKNEIKTGLWFPDLGILPELQGAGAGKKIVSAWMDSCSIHMAFPNDQAERMFRKLGWSFRYDTWSFRVMLHPENHLRIKKMWYRPFVCMMGGLIRALYRVRTFAGAKIEKQDVSAENMEPFSDLKDISVLHVPRTSDFLRWRILENPNRKENFVFKFQKGNSENFALVRIFEREGYRRMHILSMVLADPKSADSFCASLTKWALENDIAHIWVMTSRKDILKTLRFWFPLKTVHCFAFHSAVKGEMEFLNSPECYWECLDFEFDLLYT